jgi:hypothetical protein
MKKNKITSYFVLLSFLTLITIFISIVQKSYFNLKKPQDIIENNVLLKDFNPNLDLSVISTIESKNKNIEENFDFSIIKSNQPEETVSTDPIIQPTITPSLESTDSSSIKAPVEETTL